MNLFRELDALNPETFRGFHCFDKEPFRDILLEDAPCIRKKTRKQDRPFLPIKR